MALSSPGATTNPVVVNQNNTQPLAVTAVDANGVTLTGLALQYESTSPTTIPAGTGGSITPILAGAASISAVWNHPPAIGVGQPDRSLRQWQADYLELGQHHHSRNQRDRAHHGKHAVAIHDLPQLHADFSERSLPAALHPQLDGDHQRWFDLVSGQRYRLMVVNAVNQLSLSNAFITSPGTVLAVSPDGTQIVVTDPVRQTITLLTTTGSLITSYGGVGTRAQFSPDSQTLYVTAGNQLLVYSQYTGWTNLTPATAGGTPVTDVALTVPYVGAYLAGPTTTARGYCAISTLTVPTTEANVFYPPADSSPAITDRIAATSDGMHMIGASVTPAPTLSDLHVNIPVGACPATGGLTFSNTLATTVLSPITASAITGVFPTPDSSLAFITYTGTGGVLPVYAQLRAVLDRPATSNFPAQQPHPSQA